MTVIRHTNRHRALISGCGPLLTLMGGSLPAPAWQALFLSVAGVEIDDPGKVLGRIGDRLGKTNRNHLVGR